MLFGVAVGAAGQEAPPAADTAAACPAGRVAAIFVDNHSIFDTDALESGRALRWAYELANSLHVKTRESFIRRELLFRVGDCYDPLLLEESGRILRTYGFIAHADVFAVRQPDGSVHVVVDTQDEWTTKVDLGVSLDEGLQLEGLDVTEENLLGQGVLAAVFVRRRRERRDAGARVEFPRLFGSRLDGRMGGGRTRVGSFVDQEISYPFVGEVGRLALRQVYRRRDELFPYALGERSGLTHVLLPLTDERVELSMAGRIGEPGNLTIFGLGVSRESLRFDGVPGDVEVARDSDFGATTPAGDDFVAAVSGQARASSTTRLNFMIGQRNVRFVRVRGLDALNGDQDLRLGTDVGLTLGRSIDVLTGEGPGADDLYTRLRIFAGGAPGTSFLFANAGFEGRQVFSGGVDGDGWRDVLAEGDLYAYVRSRRLPGHTVFARISASGGWRFASPFQLTLGGRDGVRGFREEDDPGGQRVVLSLEDRIFVRWPLPDLFDLGFTIFADAGRMWAGDVPFGRDSGWRGTVGAGLRLGFPSGSRGVARLDLAFPLGADEARGPVFRITLFELLGLNTGFFDPQLRRSRRITVGPDFFVQERR